MNPDIFREYDIRGAVGEDLNEETVRGVARALGSYFLRNKAARIAVGFDARESSPFFRDLLVGELNAAGCDVLDVGRVPTPVLYFAVYTEPVDGGVMITGSHNPAHHNGFKICLGRRTLFGRQIRAIKKIALAGDFSGRVRHTVRRTAPGTSVIQRHIPRTETADVLPNYHRQLMRSVTSGGRRLKVVVDAGSGMGGVTAVPLYRALGYEVVELFCEPDSSFPHHEPDPSKPENLRHLISAVAQERADLGVAFDGDGDRLTAVAETGRVAWGDELMILFARDVLGKHPGATVVGEVKCTERLFEEIARLGGTPLMCKAGHSIVKAEMKRAGAVLAGEMSGHIFFADRYYGFDDAAYAGARLLELLSNSEQTLSQMLGALPPAFATPEIRVHCAEGRKSEVVKKIVAEFSAAGRPVSTVDGARIKFEHGWGLVRPSNTQALLILRCEADTEEHLRDIRETLVARVNHFIGSPR